MNIIYFVLADFVSIMYTSLKGYFLHVKIFVTKYEKDLLKIDIIKC